MAPMTEPPTTREIKRVGISAQTIAMAVLVVVFLIGAVTVGAGVVRTFDRPGNCGGLFEICDDGD